jgi:DNA-binding FrmR family transcriptional regulator
MDANAADVLKRLAFIEGHLKSIRRMLEAGRDCLAVIRQTYAVKRALDRLDEVAGELRELFALAHRH